MCCAIASLGGQEYIRLENEAVLGFAILSFIYSIPVHWIWNKNGWLKFNETEANGNEFKTRDFAGAGMYRCFSFDYVCMNVLGKNSF